MTNITTLENGLRIVTENRDFKQTTIGVFVNTGLINETKEINGISHFLEHMAFKGTTTKTAKELAEIIENLGGYTNAYTSNEETVYHVGILPENWKNGVDFLADVLQNSTFPEEELEKERNVILQELARSHDNPTHVLWNNFMKDTYTNCMLKYTILGPEENIKKFKAEDLNEYMHKYYSFDNMIISACGNIDHDEFVSYIQEKFTSLPAHHADIPEEIYGFSTGTNSYTDKFDQAHVMLALNGIPATSTELVLNQVFSNVLNGGMSCRLFQEIREKRGLAYAVSNLDECGKQFGFFGIYLGVDKEKVNEAIEASKEVLLSMTTDISDEEFEKAKNITLFSLATKYDKCFALASSNAYALLYRDHIKSYDEICDEVRGMTKQDLLNFAKRYITDDFSVSILLPNDRDE